MIDVVRAFQCKERSGKYTALQKAIADKNCAAFIFEPLIQGARWNGFAFDNLLQICQTKGQILTICR